MTVAHATNIIVCKVFMPSVQGPRKALQRHFEIRDVPVHSIANVG
jgi:hypothetical protein